MNHQEEQHRRIISWVEEHTSYLLRWAVYKTSSKELAEDLVQDTFLSATTSIDRFRESSSPRTWLMSILNNKIADYYRKSERKEKHLPEAKAVEVTDSLFGYQGGWTNVTENTTWPEESNLLDNAEFRKVMDECMDDLPEKWRHVVDSKYLLEKKAEEICQEYQITPTNYWQILHRSKLLLKKCIENGWIS